MKNGNPPYVGDKSLQKRLSKTLGPSRWLDDLCIQHVWERYRMPNGHDLPQNILILAPSITHAICQGGIEDSQEHVADFCLAEKDLVLMPISNGVRHKANSGSHWSLLLAHRYKRGGDMRNFACIHLDSVGAASNIARAQIVAKRMFHESMLVELARCAKQSNGYDCGAYLLVFASIIIKNFLRTTGWLNFSLRKKYWVVELANVKPKQVTEARSYLITCFRSARPPAEEDLCHLCDGVLSGGNCAMCDDAPYVKQKHRKVERLSRLIDSGRQCGLCGMRGHYQSSCPKRTLPVKKAGARGSSSPHDWSPVYSYAPDGGKVENTKGNNFRSLQQPSYPKVIAMTLKQMKQTLASFSLTPPLPPACTRTCHECGEALQLKVWSDRGSVLSCSGVGCTIRFKAETAYTPRYDSTVSEQEWLRSAYCFSMQERVDKTVWYAECNGTKVLTLFAAHRDVIAWYVIRCGRDIHFQTAEVDLDGAVGHISRAESETMNTHKGRLFVAKERGTKRRKYVDVVL